MRSSSKRLKRRLSMRRRASAWASARRTAAALRRRPSPPSPECAAITGGSVLEQEDVEVAGGPQPPQRASRLLVQTASRVLPSDPGRKRSADRSRRRATRNWWTPAGSAASMMGARFPSRLHRRDPDTPWRAPRRPCPHASRFADFAFTADGATPLDRSMPRAAFERVPSERPRPSKTERTPASRSLTGPSRSSNSSSAMGA